MTPSSSPIGQVTILGLGTRGTALGLALSRPELNLHVVGCDRDSKAVKKALSAGAIHGAERDLQRACRSAELIVLAVPFADVRGLLEEIAHDLKPDAVVLETAPLKIPTFEWATQGLPRERHLVGVYLLARFPAPEAPAPLYDKGLMVVVAPHGTDSSALEFTTRLAPAIGASSFFVDPHEFDGLMAGTQGLPLLMALISYRAVAEVPGWGDAGRLAGDSFAEATRLLADCNAQPAAAELSANRENLARRLDLAQEELESIRRLLSGDAEQLQSKLETLLRDAVDGRARWMASRADPARSRPTPAVELPSMADNFARMFGLGKDQLEIRRRKRGDAPTQKP